MALVLDSDGLYLLDSDGSYLADSGGADAPANTVVPSFSGFQYPGYTLTSAHGTWDEVVVSYAYKWQVADDGSGTNAADIPTATSTTYVVASAYQGKWIRFGEATTNEAGLTSAYSYSAWVQVLTIVARPAATVKSAVFNSMAGLAGLFLLNEATNGGSDADTPTPVTWKTATAAAGTYAAVAICAETASFARSNLPCGTLLSSKFALIGHTNIAIGNDIVFLRSNNSEELRTVAARWAITSTMSVVRLSSSVSTINALPLITNVGALAGQTMASIESDRSFSLHAIGVIQAAYINFLTSLATGGSNKPGLIYVDGTLCNLGPAVLSTTLENASTYIDEICAILATQSEAPTLVTVGGGEGGFSGGLSGALLGCLDGGFA